MCGSCLLRPIERRKDAGAARLRRRDTVAQGVPVSVCRKLELLAMTTEMLFEHWGHVDSLIAAGTRSRNEVTPHPVDEAGCGGLKADVAVNLPADADHHEQDLLAAQPSRFRKLR